MIVFDHKMAPQNKLAVSHRQTDLTPLLSQLSQCLSRACLGKIIVSIHKWLKRWRFSHLDPTSTWIRSQLRKHWEKGQGSRLLEDGRGKAVFEPARDADGLVQSLGAMQPPGRYVEHITCPSIQNTLRVTLAEAVIAHSIIRYRAKRQCCILR